MQFVSPAAQPDADRRYHHGDLKNALTDAAAALAASDGPEQVTVRAVAKKVGVTPTAAYRHFAGHDELVQAVKDRAMTALTEAIEKALAQVVPASDPRVTAVRRLAASGRGYCTFATTEPGLFRTAFCRADDPEPSTPLAEALLEHEPYRLLVDIVDGMVTAGVVAESERTLVEAAAWSSVHGLSMLLIDGPLRLLAENEKAALIDGMLTYISARWANIEID